MIWKGWNNGSKLASGSGYGLRMSANDRDSHFKKKLKSVTIRLPHAGQYQVVNVNITDSFWSRCSEVRSKEIGKWLISNGYAPWPMGSPPKFTVEQIGDRIFELNDRTSALEKARDLAQRNTRTDFTVPSLPDTYLEYSKIIAEKLRGMTDVPDLRRFQSILIFSDYGGEHTQASFYTYSFLVCGYDELDFFFDKMKELRELHGLNNPYKEIAYKDLRYGPIKRSLLSYLENANNYVPGFLATIAIDRTIQSVITDNYDDLIETLKENGFGLWGSQIAEKLFRVLHPIAIILATLTQTGQKFLWMGDHDAISEDGIERNFSNTQNIFMHVLNMYTDNEYEISGFAKPFDENHLLGDLLSLTDIAAGATQDILADTYGGSEPESSEMKKNIQAWLGRDGVSLRKFNVMIRKNGDYWESCRVTFDQENYDGLEILLTVPSKRR